QVQRRPVVMVVASLAVLLVAAIPLLSIRLGVADEGNDPRSLTTRRAYDLLAKGFGPGFNGAVLLAADLRGGSSLAQVSAFVASLRNDRDVAFVAPVNANPARDAAVASIIPKGAPQDRSTEEFVHRVRREIKAAGLTVHAGRETAIAIDAADHAGAPLA